MGIATLSNVMKFFAGKEPTPEERRLLVKEALVLTLARASRADTNIQPVEVDTVRRIIKDVTGDDVSAADIRVAANSELFERASLEKCLARLSSELKAQDRVLIVQSLAEVIKSDVRVSHFEVEFFDRVAEALKVTPAGAAGLFVEQA